MGLTFPMVTIATVVAMLATGCTKSKSSETSSDTTVGSGPASGDHRRALDDDLRDRKTGGGRGDSPGGGSSGMPAPITRGNLGLVDLSEDFTAVGEIDKSVVRTTVKANLAKLQSCYEKTLLANPGIAGKCIANFKVAIDGSVRDVKATGVHPDVESCVADVVRGFKFPTTTTEVEVSYPFAFRAN